MTIKVQELKINVPLLRPHEVHALPVTGKDGDGTRHKHGAAFTQIDFTDTYGNRYTGNCNIQVQSLAEQMAAKNMPKDPATDRKQKFNASAWLAENPDQLVAPDDDA